MPFLRRDFQVPAVIETQRFRMRSITIHAAFKDYDAVMSSREHLWGRFGAAWGWPREDLTIEQNIVDLGWHQKEFQLRSSFDCVALPRGTCSRAPVVSTSGIMKSTFSLLQLSDDQLRAIAASRIPADFAQRLEAGALPPEFVAARALSLLAQGHARIWCCSYLIIREHDQRVVGGCGFKNAPKSGRVEIGYGVSHAAQGQGAATAAVRLLVKAAFGAGVREVLAEINPTNHASQRVVQKAGFADAGSRVDEDEEYVVQWVACSDA